MVVAMRFAAVLLTLALAAACVRGAAAPPDTGRPVPAPALDVAPASRTSEVAVLAGGCFWGVQAVYQHVNGVTSAVSGYAGGREEDAEYGAVSSGRTRHAEAVRIVFDPRVVSYGALLQIFFSVGHDPTELNRQGPDEGPQYRSAIFPGSEEQARVARAYITQLNDARVFPADLATVIEPGRAFFRAEEAHQDFLERNRSNRYIVTHDLPKLAALQRLFPARYRAKPVLTGAALR
jgi:peptide-methionine (S)-S-oxide reductase